MAHNFVSYHKSVVLCKAQNKPIPVCSGLGLALRRGGTTRSSANELVSRCDNDWQSLVGEFDPGSGRTLAARLIHASRTGTSSEVLVADG